MKQRDDRVVNAIEPRNLSVPEESDAKFIGCHYVVWPRLSNLYRAAFVPGISTKAWPRASARLHANPSFVHNFAEALMPCHYHLFAQFTS